MIKSLVILLRNVEWIFKICRKRTIRPAALIPEDLVWILLSSASTPRDHTVQVLNFKKINSKTRNSLRRRHGNGSDKQELLQPEGPG